MSQYKRRDDIDKGKRRKTWDEKVTEVQNSFQRGMNDPNFFNLFYKNLFFLNPKLEDYFLDTNWKNQKVAIEKGMKHLLGFLTDDPDGFNKQNIARIGQTHSKHNMNIHPHSYYYWIDAMIMTLRDCDRDWYEGLNFYTRECLFFPISYIISMYHLDITS